MATKSSRVVTTEEPITVRQLVGLAEAVQMLQGMLIDALLTLPQDQRVDVSAAWLRRYARLGGIRIGKGCADCSAPVASRAASKSIRIGKSC